MAGPPVKTGTRITHLRHPARAFALCTLEISKLSCRSEAQEWQVRHQAEADREQLVADVNSLDASIRRQQVELDTESKQLENYKKSGANLDQVKIKKEKLLAKKASIDS